MNLRLNTERCIVLSTATLWLLFVSSDFVIDWRYTYHIRILSEKKKNKTNGKFISKTVKCENEQIDNNERRFKMESITVIDEDPVKVSSLIHYKCCSIIPIIVVELTVLADPNGARNLDATQSWKRQKKILKFDYHFLFVFRCLLRSWTSSKWNQNAQENKKSTTKYPHHFDFVVHFQFSILFLCGVVAATLSLHNDWAYCPAVTEHVVQHSDTFVLARSFFTNDSSDSRLFLFLSLRPHRRLENEVCVARKLLRFFPIFAIFF